jgi:hypothetical protein
MRKIIINVRILPILALAFTLALTVTIGNIGLTYGNTKILNSEKIRFIADDNAFSDLSRNSTTTTPPPIGNGTTP